jgi:hypothetical protein
MHMRKYLSRWSQAVAVLTALAVFATSTKAFAAQSGESNYFTPESVGFSGQFGNDLATYSSYS